jgi:hypothetical protein
MKKVKRRAARSVPGTKRRPRVVTFVTACRLASALPGVEEGMSWGTPGLKVKGRFLARLKEDGVSLVLRIGLLEREELLERAPDVFYVTDHYLNYPAVLIRLPKIKEGLLKELLTHAWHEVAPESLGSGARARSGAASGRARSNRLRGSRGSG